MGKGRLGMIISAITLISTLVPVAVKGVRAVKAAKTTGKGSDKSSRISG